MGCDIPDGLSFSRVPLHLGSHRLVVESELLTWQLEPEKVKKGAAKSLKT